MLSVEQELLSLLNPRTDTPSLSAVTGTNIDKIVHALNKSGIHAKYDVRVNRQWKTQISTELAKLSGDPSLQRFLHSVRMFADWNKDDIRILQEEDNLSPELMNDTDKAWNSLDKDTITSQLELFLLNRYIKFCNIGCCKKI